MKHKNYTNNFMTKFNCSSTKSALFIMLMIISLKLFAQDDYYDDDEDIDVKSSFIMALVRGGILLIGRGLAEVKSKQAQVAF
jgi:hypothetical protein